MSYGPEHKPKTHARIVDVASRLFRTDGMHATGIDRLMAEAGLTRGGFYAHFDSKAALFSEALRAGLVEARDKLMSRGLEKLAGNAWIRAATRRYLAPEHRDNPAGCVVPTLAAEVARAPDEVRSTFNESIGEILGEMAERSGRTRDEATAMLAMWVGAMTLARAMNDEAEAKRVLEACKAHMHQAFGLDEDPSAS